jgi:hypothetical protein
VWTHEAEEKDGKDRERDDDVETVPLEGEGHGGESYPGQGRGKQEHDSKLHDAAGVEGRRVGDDVVTRRRKIGSPWKV